MLDALSLRSGAKVLNSARGIALHNEKLLAYQGHEAVPSFVGLGATDFIAFARGLVKDGVSEMILKPLDLYQGIGVEKVSLKDEAVLLAAFKAKVDEYKGPVVAQPFLSEVAKGEVRSIYFKGRELGSIIKTPKQGEFLANIAQGASYEAYTLTKGEREACDHFAADLALHGVDWIAYDVLGGKVQEVNITCPGLLVEVAKAVGRDLAREIAEALG
jgi:glutathione synthase